MKVLYFMADWCSPCKRFLPTVEAVCHERGVSLAKIDVGENPDFARGCNVSSVPTVIVTVDEDAVFHRSGIFSRQELESALDEIGG
ncbi:MAG: thioredoxin family protein [Oscillospiraceae bacterium]|nr:thioredoxin family protein [Oscillospiraceae bacterium]